MTIYAVGDIQGCLDPLRRLLDTLAFSPDRDQLWSVGDIVNRGPQSLETMRFLKALGSGFRMVLGNHDLHLLAAARGYRKPTPKDTLEEIISAHDAEDLLNWLQAQPLLIQDQGYVMTHAGIPPQWSLANAKARAEEVENVLRSPRASLLFDNMYGDAPALWRDDLPSPARWRVITNYFTRMRFCTAEGELELTCKLEPEQGPRGYAPWYAHSNRKATQEKLIFGHWAALNGRDCGAGLYPLDTGCVWGNRLRILDLETGAYHHCDCAH